jgi:hypothetical protein
MSENSGLFIPAERRNILMRAGITGPSGAGKTLGALRLAGGLTDGDWSKVFYIQLEAKDGNVFSRDDYWGIGQFQSLREPINPPYAPERIMPILVQAGVEAGEDGVVILDGASEIWAGQGGTLETHRALGGSFSDWDKVNPQWFEVVNWLTKVAPCHTITTIKAKSQYVQEQDDQGKWNVRELGLAPIIRPQTEYNFNLFLSLDQDTHKGKVVAKSGSMIPETDHAIEITQAVGETLRNWMNGGIPVEVRVYGDGGFADWTNELETTIFDHFKKENDQPPHTKRAAWNWWKENSRRILAEEEE